MPSVVDYEQVQAQAARQGLRSLYHNSGAFGFPAGAETWSVGWIGPADDSIRPAARPLVRQVQLPYPATLARLLSNVVTTVVPGRVWLLPKSHWAYELDFGSATWMPDLLRGIDISPAALQPRNNAAAIEFSADESARLTAACEALLERLSGSDFALLFPDRPLLCTVHSHQQLWWTTSDSTLFEQLNVILPTTEPSGQSA